jgi:Fic family protein
MKWNWQLKLWPEFVFDVSYLKKNEQEFLIKEGEARAFLKHVPQKDKEEFIVEILTLEGTQSSKIEGEILDRESLQSSIKRHFGLKSNTQRDSKKESGMSKALIDLYQSYNETLTHEMLYKWHKLLFEYSSNLSDVGSYRTHQEPMQIVSNRLGVEKIYFEAPPSILVKKEMDRFIEWYNNFKGPLLIKAGIAHVYFESIHPFEDGNGRIGRLIAEKTLSQGIGRPILIAISRILESKKKQYYAELEKCNHSLEINEWLIFFSQVVLEAQQSSLELLEFLINKTRFFLLFANSLNERQLKVLLRIFKEGPSGFLGGLSAENYIAITKTSRATATRDLIDLIEKNALIKTGQLRHTRYYINLNF